MIAERTRDKIHPARKKGKWTGGPVPYGYDVQNGKLFANELEAVVVREIYDGSRSSQRPSASPSQGLRQ